MENNYCSLLKNIIKKYDMFGLIKVDHIDNFCNELSYINFLLKKYYEIINKKDTDKSNIITELISIRDKDENKILNNIQALEIYEKFKKLNSYTNKGGEYTEIYKNKDIKIYEDQKNLKAKKKLQQVKKMENLKKIQSDIKKKKEIIKIETNLKEENKDIKQKKKKYKKLKKKIDYLDSKIIKENDDINKRQKFIKNEKEKFILDNKKELNKDKKNLSITKNKLKEEISSINNLKKQINKTNKLIESKRNLLDFKEKKKESNLNDLQKQIINKDFDMMELLLICLSLLPIAGWTFDLPLFIYSIVKKKYNLAIITILNWYIWGFWLIFGLNINMGPSMKVSYLGNKQNYIKNGLLNNYEDPKKNIDPYTDVKIVNVEGKKYLKDSKGIVYEPLISNPKIIGVIDNKSDTFIQKSSPDYYHTLSQNQK